MHRSKQAGIITIISITPLLMPLMAAPAVAGDALEIKIPVQVYADVGAFKRREGADTTTTSTTTPGRDGAFVGTLTLFVSPQLGDHIRGLFEAVSEFNEAGMHEIAVERAQIGYAYNDALTVWGGRFHTPYGYWNTAYPHGGAQLQPSIARPVQLSGSLPEHTIGLWVTGLFNMGVGKLTYDAYVGNASRVVDGAIDPNHSAGDNQSKNFGGNIGYNAGGPLGGLRVGVHALRAKVTVCGAVTDTGNCKTPVLGKSDLNIHGAYAHYENHNLELFAEYYRFKNTNLISSFYPGYKARSSSGFVQLGYALAEDWMPYIRYEETGYDQNDEYFKNLSNGRSYGINTLGVRYELHSNAVLKAEFSQIKSRTASTLNDSKEMRVQYAIRF